MSNGLQDWALNVQQRWVQIQYLPGDFKKYFCMYCESAQFQMIRMCCIEQPSVRQQVMTKQSQQLEYLFIFKHRIKIVNTPSGLTAWTLKQLASLNQGKATYQNDDDSYANGYQEGD